MSEKQPPELPEHILRQVDRTGKSVLTSQEIQAAQTLGAIARGDIELGETGFYDTTIGDLHVSVDPNNPNNPYVSFIYAAGTEREAEFGFGLTVHNEGPIIVRNNLRRTSNRGEGFGTNAFFSLERTFMAFSEAQRRPIEIEVFEIDNQPRVVNWYKRMGYTPHHTDNPDSRTLSKIIKA